MIEQEAKLKIIKNHSRHEKDTGSSEVQVAILSARITDLTEHFKSHNKDHHSRRGLLKLVGRRRKLLEYLKKNNLESYKRLIQSLGLRK